MNTVHRLLCVLSLTLMSGSHGIIVRHDANPADYLADPADYPAVFFLEQQGLHRACVATLIHPRWAVSAAHCADQTLLRETLRQRRRFAVSVGGKLREIDAMIQHPDFDMQASSDVDLMLLRFRNAVDEVSPYPVQLDDGEAGRVAQLLGWGYTGAGLAGRDRDDGKLRMARNVIDVAAQRLRIRFDDPRDRGDQPIVQEGMPSLGDSGGPLLIETDSGLVLAGVAVGEVQGPDFSEDTQGKYGSIAVYERLSSHLRWIETVIGAELPFQS